MGKAVAVTSDGKVVNIDWDPENPKCDMTPEKLAELKKRFSESVSYDLQQLVCSEKFISGMILRFEIVPVRDFRINTACTDGQKIYFDLDWYSKLTKDERVFVLAHEVWHNIFLHFLRRNGRERELWNIATDCEINSMLEQEGLKAPEGLCFPTDSEMGLNAEEIYEMRHKKQKSNQKMPGMNGMSSSSGTKGNGNQSSGSSGSGSKPSSGFGGASGQFDKHIEKGDQENDQADGEGMPNAPTDKWGEKGYDSDYNPQISEDAADKIREMVMSEANRVERSKGSLPNHIKRVVDRFRKPEINWREYLSQFVTSCFGDKRVWLPPNRRMVWQDLYMQSRRGEKIKIVCVVDTSGSTQADLPKFLTELVSLLNTFGNYELTIINVDCTVQSVDVFDEMNQFPVDNPIDYKFSGGGGSDLTPAFEEINKRVCDASAIVVFTDGYIDCPKKNPTGIPTLFILTSDGAEDFCDWGNKVKFKEKRSLDEI